MTGDVLMTPEYCICGSPIGAREPFSSNFFSVRCRYCAAIAFMPLSSEMSASFDYQGNDRKYGGAAIDNISMRWAHQRLLSLLEDSPAVVEIGCYTGFFLAALRSRGVDVYGIDLNQKAVSYGKDNYDLAGRLATSEAGLQEYSADSPDLIFVDCLEHVARPDALIDGYLASFAPRRVVISGPLRSRAVVDRSDFPPHHLWRFTENSLDLLMDRKGFCRQHTEYEYNLGLLIRNIMGRLLYCRSRENWGHQRSFEGLKVGKTPFFRGFISKTVSRWVLRALGSYHASSILIYERKPS